MSVRGNRVVRDVLVVGAMIAALGIGLAVAAPVQWTTGSTLTADRLNGITVIDAGGTLYSVGATTYCGESASPTTGKFLFANKSGYAAAKAICEAAPACGMSKTAHMCTAEELVRSAQLGMMIPYGWYSTGVLAVRTAAPLQNNVYYTEDCTGWTWEQANVFGPAWASSDDCKNPHKILCCD